MLAVSEMFYSIQGEGPNTGRNSIFLRLKGCNLTCGGKSTAKTGLLDSGASWRCDTLETWLEGDQLSFTDIIDFWEIQKWTSAQQLVITGGEPLLQAAALTQFFPILFKRLPHIKIEVESNATLIPPQDWANYPIHFNLSPKLSNSGMPKQRRICNEVLAHFSKSNTCIFKFVLTTQKDYSEITQDFISPYQIPDQKVWLMPGADCRNSLAKLSLAIVELAIANHHNFSSRLHIQLWDKKTGV